MSRHTQELRALRVNFQQVVFGDDLESLREFLHGLFEVLEDAKSFSPKSFSSRDLLLEREKIAQLLQISAHERGLYGMDFRGRMDVSPSTIDNDDSDSEENSPIVIREVGIEEIESQIIEAQEEQEMESFIVWTALSLLHKVAYRTGELKRVQQIMAVEIFHTLLDTLGIRYFDPKRSSIFQEYVDSAMSSGMIKFSSWLAKEAVRAYRNAEQSGRLFEVTKLPAPEDRSKVIDYYSFNEGGRATALRDLRNLGISENAIIEIVSIAETSMPLITQKAQAESQDVSRRIQELVDRAS